MVYDSVDLFVVPDTVYLIFPEHLHKIVYSDQYYILLNDQILRAWVEQVSDH